MRWKRKKSKKRKPKPNSKKSKKSKHKNKSKKQSIKIEVKNFSSNLLEMKKLRKANSLGALKSSDKRSV